MLHWSIHQERSTPFLDKTRRQTGPESPLPSLWCLRVPPRLQRSPGARLPSSPAMSTMNSLFHVQNGVQQCYHITQVKYFQFLPRFSPTHGRTEDLEFQKLRTKARNPSDAGVKNLLVRVYSREGLEPYMVFWFLCATAKPPAQSQGCVCLGLLAQLQLARRGR